jgi:hypothetical protein
MEVEMTGKKDEKTKDKAVAYKDGRKPGPDESKVQIRPAGQESTADNGKWDERDEASDESFPASDSSAKY